MKNSAFNSVSLVFAAVTSPSVHAESLRDGAATLGRDIGLKANDPLSRKPMVPVLDVKAGEPDVAVEHMIFIGAVHVEGAAGIAMALFAPAIEPFIGKAAGSSDLQNLARAVADVARDHGYVFASAFVPAQSVDTGTLTVRLDMGRVDHVRLVGAGDAHLIRIVRSLEGQAVQRRTLERQLLLAGEVPGIRVTRSRYVREGGRGILIIEVSKAPAEGQIAFNNSGSHELGPARLEMRVDMNALALEGDQLTAQIVTTPLQPRELAFASLRYGTAIGTDGLRAGMTGSVGRTEPDYGGAHVVGKSKAAALFANQPLIRTHAFSLWATADISYSHSDQRFEGYEFQRDNMLVASGGLIATGVVGGGRLWTGVSIVQGVGLSGLTKAGDPFASRPDAGSAFTKMAGWLDWTRSITEQVSIRLAASGQLSDRPLLAAQELGFGGPAFGRAYDYNEASGDQGLLGLLEIRQRFSNLGSGINWVQFYEFLDAGYVSDIRGGDRSGVSTGAGVRAQMGRLNLGVEAAIPIDAKRARSNDKSPRLNLLVGRAF